jgi:hypothetical protein
LAVANRVRVANWDAALMRVLSAMQVPGSYLSQHTRVGSSLSNTNSEILRKIVKLGNGVTKQGVT